MPVLPAVSSEIEINGVAIPAFSWTVEVGTYGQLGRAIIRTTLSALRRAGVTSIPALTSGTNIVVTIDLNGVRLFGGLYLHSIPFFHRDEIEIVARDYAAPLFDSVRSIADLTNNVSLSVQGGAALRISDLVAEIGLAGGFSVTGPSQLQGSGQSMIIDIPAGEDIPVGTILDQGAILASNPTRLWTLLVYLARMTRCTVYTTAGGVLHFEPQSPTPTIHEYSYFAQPGTGSQSIAQTTAQGQDVANLLGGLGHAPPILELEGLHQPARNKNFTVICTSHHQQSTVTTQVQITVLGETIAVGKTKKLPAGTYRASGGGIARSTLSSRNLGIPEFVIPLKPGLTEDQVRQQASAYAAEIASKLLIITAVVNGDTTIQPRNRLNIHEGKQDILMGFSDWPFYITSVTHTFAVPQSNAIERIGFLTTIKGLTIPPNTVEENTLETLTEGN